MLAGKQSFLFFIILAIILAACGQQPLPTQVPRAQLPAATPTSHLPPTLDISNQPTIEQPTQVTNTPKPTATPLPANFVINITAPRANEVLTLGNEITVRGLVEMEDEQAILLSLITNNGRVLAQTPGLLTDTGWEASISLPPHVSGLAKLWVTFLDDSGNTLAEHERPVLLKLNPETTDRYLALNRPRMGETAVGGFNIFFDGLVFHPVNNFVTISIWANDCQEQVAQQGFQMGSSSKPFYWQGFVVVPKDLTGPACAVAYFGEPGTEEWREVQIPIDVLAKDDSEARGVTIGNPPPESEVFAGDELFIYGTANNVAAGPVTVSILMENGRIVGQASTETDYWGYWEATLLLPFDVLGLAEITVIAGEDDTLSENQAIVNVLPAPTPTP